MSGVDVSSESAVGTPPVKQGEFKLEVVVVPVSDTIGRRSSTQASAGGSTPTLRAV